MTHMANAKVLLHFVILVLLTCQICVADDDQIRLQWHRRVHGAGVTSILFDQQSECFLSSSADGSLVCWDPTKHSDSRVKCGSRIFGMCLNRNSTLVALVTNDGIQVWDHHQQVQFGFVPSSTAKNIAFLGPDDKLLTAYSGVRVGLVDWRRRGSSLDFERDNSRRDIAKHSLRKIDSYSAIAISPKANIAVLGHAGKIDVFNVESGKLLCTVNNDDESQQLGDTACFLSFSPTGDALIAVYDGGSIRTWETKSWAKIKKLDRRGGTITAMALAPNGESLVVGIVNYLVRIDLETDSETVLFKDAADERTMYSTIAFSSKGDQLAVGVSDGSIRLFEVISPPKVELDSH